MDSTFRLRFAVAAITLTSMALGAGCRPRDPIAPDAAGSISGTVQCTDGSPARTAPVWILGPGLVVGIEPWDEFANTNDLGQFHFSNLKPGKWLVEATGVCGMIVDSVEVLAGRQSVANLHLEPAGHFYGVATLQGQPSSAGVSVSVNGTYFFAPADSAGNYQLDVPPGTWTLTASTFTPGWRAVSTTVTMPAPGDSAAVPPLVLTPIGSAVRTSLGVP